MQANFNQSTVYDGCCNVVGTVRTSAHMGLTPKLSHSGSSAANFVIFSLFQPKQLQDEDHSRSSYRVRLRRQRQRHRVAGQPVRGTDVSYHATALHFSGEKLGKRAEDFITAKKCRLHPCVTKPELAFRRWLQNKGKPVLERMHVMFVDFKT